MPPVKRIKAQNSDKFPDFKLQYHRYSTSASASDVDASRNWFSGASGSSHSRSRGVIVGFSVLGLPLLRLCQFLPEQPARGRVGVSAETPFKDFGEWFGLWEWRSRFVHTAISIDCCF